MSKKRRTLTAAGAVVLDGFGPAARVLVVHRPHYDDWTLPKGKPVPDEDLQVTAVREVGEETGLRIRLGRPLPMTEYPVGKRDKTVHWWHGSVTGGHLRERGTAAVGDEQEVDRVEWWSLDKASRKLSHADEAGLVDLAASYEPGHTLLLVRHGKAMLRKHWSGKDWKRPLSERGRRQSARVALLLDAYGVMLPVTSTSTRCVQTMQPYADHAGLDLVEVHELSEEAFEEDADASRRTMIDLLNDARARPNAPMAICGHRPLLPTMQDLMGLPEKSMLVAETMVAHHDASGRQLAVERIKSAF